MQSEAGVALATTTSVMKGIDRTAAISIVAFISVARWCPGEPGRLDFLDAPVSKRI